MNIGLFTDTFLPIVDGVGRVVLAYAETLAALGHKVTVSAPLNETDHRGGYPFDLIDYASIKVPTAPQYKTGSPILDTHYRLRMAGTALDIVHAHSPFGAGAEALRVAREKNIPLVGTFHSKYYDDFYKLTKSDFLSRMLVKSVVAFYNKCDEVWAVSESTAQVLKSYGYRKKVHVMPNGVTVRQADEESIQMVVEKYRLQDKPLLLFVGQINWKKNILRVLESAAMLQNNGVDFILLLAGQGPDEKEVEQKIKSLGLEENAMLIGHLTDINTLSALYARADLFVFPSLYDNAPMVIREAAVMGTPSVLVRGSSAAEIIEDGINGFLSDDDSGNLFHVLNNALANPAQTHAIGQKAQQTIPQPWEQIMEHAVSRYQALIDTPNDRYKHRKRHQQSNQ